MASARSRQRHWTSAYARRRGRPLTRLGLLAAVLLVGGIVAAADNGDREGEGADARDAEHRQRDHAERRRDGDRDREHAEGHREGDREGRRGDGRHDGERERPRLLERGEDRPSPEAITPGPFSPHREADGERGDPPPLDEAHREAALAVLADVYPRLAERLNEAQEANPRRAEWALRKMWPRLHRLVELRERDPAMYRLRVADQRHKVETLRLVHQLRRAQRRDEAPARPRELRAKLRDRVNEHFEVRQRMRRHELEQLAERIEQLRAELQRRQTNRDQLISRYIEALVNRERGDRDDHHRPDLDEARE